jgi:hypothetical protein
LNSEEGRRRAAAIITERPTASLREVAATAGISVGTAHDVRQRIRRGESPVRNISPNPERRDEQRAFSHSDPTSLSPAEKKPRPQEKPDIDAQTILQSLARDPALKQTDAGRELLRWLHTHIVDSAEWDPLLGAIPAYRLKSLARLALQCGDAWYQFAHELEYRERLID